MKETKLKYILLSALIPVLVISLVMSIQTSLRLNELNLIGIVIALYYFVPVILFTFAYVGLLRGARNLGFDFFATSIIAQFSTSIILALLFFTVWVLLDGSTNNYRGLSFPTYWTSELQRFWMPLIFFAVPIPILLMLFGKQKK